MVKSIQLRTIGRPRAGHVRTFITSTKHKELFDRSPSSDAYDVRGVHLVFSPYTPSFADDKEEVAIVYEYWSPKWTTL